MNDPQPNVDYFVAITLSATWGRQRTYPVTWRGYLSADNPGSLFYSAVIQGKKAWYEKHRTVSSDGFVVDFYHVEQKNGRNRTAGETS